MLNPYSKKWSRDFLCFLHNTANDVHKIIKILTFQLKFLISSTEMGNFFCVFVKIKLYL